MGRFALVGLLVAGCGPELDPVDVEWLVDSASPGWLCDAAVADDGTVFVGTVSGAAVLLTRIDPDGNARGTIELAHGERPDRARCRGMAVDDQGVVHVLVFDFESFEGSVVRVAPDGSVTSVGLPSALWAAGPALDGAELVVGGLLLATESRPMSAIVGRFDADGSERSQWTFDDTDGIRDLAVAPDGSIRAVTDADCRGYDDARFFDLDPGLEEVRHQRVLGGEAVMTVGIGATAFAPDGDLLVTPCPMNGWYVERRDGAGEVRWRYEHEASEVVTSQPVVAADDEQVLAVATRLDVEDPSNQPTLLAVTLSPDGEATGEGMLPRSGVHVAVVPAGDGSFVVAATAGEPRTTWVATIRPP